MTILLSSRSPLLAVGSVLSADESFNEAGRVETRPRRRRVPYPPSQVVRGRKLAGPLLTPLSYSRVRERPSQPADSRPTTPPRANSPRPKASKRISARSATVERSRCCPTAPIGTLRRAEDRGPVRGGAWFTATMPITCRTPVSGRPPSTESARRDSAGSRGFDAPRFATEPPHKFSVAISSPVGR